MSDLTNYGENALLRALVDFSSATLHIALHTADPGETGATAEVSETGYARQATAFTVTGSTATSAAQADFTHSGATITVTHFSIWDAASGGNCIAKAALADARSWPAGPLVGLAGAWSVTLD